MLLGEKTKFYKDVRVKIMAGMPLNNTKDNKLKNVGFDVFRHYFDTKEKDYQVGVERIKRVINK